MLFWTPYINGILLSAVRNYGYLWEFFTDHAISYLTLLGEVPFIHTACALLCVMKGISLDLLSSCTPGLLSPHHQLPVTTRIRLASVRHTSLHLRHERRSVERREGSSTGRLLMSCLCFFLFFFVRSRAHTYGRGADVHLHAWD